MDVNVVSQLEDRARVSSDFKRRLRRLFIGAIPYVLFLIALSWISIGSLRFVERESVLAMFLTQKDDIITANEWHGKDWATSIPDERPTVYPGKRATVREDDILLVPFFYIGEKIGTIKFPSIDHSVDAIQGDEEPQFRLGAGHSLHTYLPGQDNNSVFGAHRTTYFKKLENIKVGDAVNFEAVYGYFKYKIDEIRIINGGDNSVAKETSKEQLTLYTCYPFTYFGNAPKRFVLICSLVESEIYK
jgi:sortase A